MLVTNFLSGLFGMAGGVILIGLLLVLLLPTYFEHEQTLTQYHQALAHHSYSVQKRQEEQKQCSEVSPELTKALQTEGYDLSHTQVVRHTQWEVFLLLAT